MSDRFGQVARKAGSIFIAGLLIGQSVAPAWGAQFTVFQKTFTRERGENKTFTDNFGVLSTGTTWTLNVVNGDPKVESAFITLNGKRILGEDQFHPDLRRDEKDLKDDQAKVKSDSDTVKNDAAEYQEDVKKYGANSSQAKQASTRLTQAQKTLQSDESDVTKDEADIAKDKAAQSGNFSEMISLLMNNILKSRIEGKPGSKLTLDILGVDNQPPALTWISPTANQIFSTPNFSAQLKLTDDISGIDTTTVTILLDTASVRASFPPIAAPTLSAILQANLTAGHGKHTLTAQAKDKAGNPAQASVSFAMDHPPVANAGSAQSVSVNTSATLNGSGSSDPDNDPLTYQWTIKSAPTGSHATLSGATSASPTFMPDIAGTFVISLVVNDGFLNSAPATVTITATSASLPPNPSTIAPALNRTVATPLATQVQFLYTGSNPIQTGVSSTTISVVRAAVVRGKVLARDGSALTGVTMSILNHPEFGQTLSRADGMFDLVVNGGGPLIVNYSKAGFLPTQRQVNPSWQQFAIAPNVVLVPVDPNVTSITPNSSTLQLARGGVVGDSSGVRQQTIMFMPGTSATMVMANGASSPLASMSVRATEYTIGTNGPTSMPSQLPASSAYTYAVEFSLDEAISAGAVRVQFNQPVVAYLENFLGFPIGSVVPSGYYDRVRGLWVPSQNGLVLKVLGTSGGSAQLDVDGSGTAASAVTLSGLGISSAELQQLAALYAVGQSLWRVPVDHFTPWDWNWESEVVSGEFLPPLAPPIGNITVDNSEKICGSVIDCQNQFLGETVPINGTPFSLNYTSSRSSGYLAPNAATVILDGSPKPQGLLSEIDLNVNVAGQQISETFADAGNLATTIQWDGKNAYGQEVQGAQIADVKVSYVFQANYALSPSFPSDFATNSELTPSSLATRANQTVTQSYGVALGQSWHAKDEKLGGWSIDVHHSYDPVGKVLYLGDGTRRGADQIYNNNVIRIVAGNVTLGGGYAGDGGPATQAQLSNPSATAAGPDGSLFISDSQNNVIRRVDSAGVITTFAGNGTGGSTSGDGGPALNAQIPFPGAVALGPDGSLYIADAFELTRQRVRRVDPSGVITTFAGGASASGEGIPAVQAQFQNITALAASADGSVFISDGFANQVFKVGTDGLLRTIAGNGNSGFSGDGGQATAAQLSNPSGIAVGPTGNLIIADTGNQVVRSIGLDGIISTVAGTAGTAGFSGDGGPAAQSQLNNPTSVAVAKDGSILIVDQANAVIRKVGVDGIITTFAGNRNALNGADGAPADQVVIGVNNVSIGPDGTAFLTDNNLIRAVSSSLPGVSAANSILIPSSDGNQVFVFDQNNRHTATLNALTGAALLTFGYDANGLLVTITDGDGNLTTIARDALGNPLSITGPFGQKTTVALDSNGFLSAITDPAAQTTAMTYDANGLMQSFKDPNGNLHQMTYDALGRLTKDQDPAGGFTALSRTDLLSGPLYSNSPSVITTRQSALGRTNTYNIAQPDTGQVETDTAQDGTQTLINTGLDGTVATTAPDGTTATQLLGADPRWGVNAPLNNQTVTTPDGLMSIETTSRQVSLADPTNLLSLSGQTDTVSVNNRAYSTMFSSQTLTFANSTPTGRQSISTIDAQGRIVGQQTANLNPVALTYDSHGRLSSTTQGSGASARATTFAYGSDGRLATITDPLNRQTNFIYDAAGRVTSQTLPGNRTVAYTYDANGNVTSITPPGKTAHMFAYTSVDLQSQYTPPAVAGVVAPQTTYAYNVDRQPTLITRPDGQTISFVYDGAGRISTTTIPSRLSRS